MKPESGVYLRRSRKVLAEARGMLDANFVEAAGRNAYLAGFHAAQAILFERTGRVFKTHNGVHSEFARLTHGDPRWEEPLRSFLSRCYELKAVADYESDPDAEPQPEIARAALAEAERFVASVASGLER